MEFRDAIKCMERAMAFKGVYHLQFEVMACMEKVKGD
jgi:hypothetical protein